MAKHLSAWAIEGKRHLQKYRPKMASRLEQVGKLDDWAQKAANRAIEESSQSIQNGMSPLEAQSEAKKNHLFLPSEEHMPELGADPNALPDPASLITTPGVIRRKKSARRLPPGPCGAETSKLYAFSASFLAAFHRIFQ